MGLGCHATLLGKLAPVAAAPQEGFEPKLLCAALTVKDRIAREIASEFYYALSGVVLGELLIL